ncbi:putative autophagy-related protein 101 [Elsinoe fawcettii]|nr:putative autophagy-related protein 101 [Elsinoe fawcettii]
MEERKAPEYTLDIFADRSCVKDVVKAILHTIFFHRYFTPLEPKTHDLFDVTLPVVNDVELETLIDQRAVTLARQFEISPYGASGTDARLEGGRGQVVVQFMEKKRRKGWFGGKADDELVWESWVLDVTLATPRSDTEVVKARRAMESTLQRTALKIINIVNRDRNHIPPITTNETNPFPYQILVNPRSEGWGRGMGIF